MCKETPHAGSRVSYRVLRHGREWLPKGQFIHGGNCSNSGKLPSASPKWRLESPAVSDWVECHLIALRAEATATAGRVEEAVATHETLAHVQQPGEQVELCR